MAVKILVVDDEPDVSVMVSQQFEANHVAGFEVKFLYAFNGQEALKQIEKNPDTQVVLTDINMPIMSGLELLGHINQRWPTIKVVVISAYGDMKNIRKSMNEGAFDFIVKPFDPLDLELTAASAIVVAEEIRYKAIEKRKNEEKEKELEEELEKARLIQDAITPKIFPNFRGKDVYEIYGAIKPYHDISADFFDFYPLDSNTLAMVIGDVSGNGVPAAFFMSMSIAAVRNFTSKGHAITDAMKQANDYLCARNENSMFASVFFAVLDLEKQILHYSNAGHTPAMVLQNDGTVIELAKNQSPPLATLEDISYVENTLQLENFNSLFFYSKGVSEAANENGEQYTKMRIKDILQHSIQKSAHELVDNITTDVQKFMKKAKRY